MIRQQEFERRRIAKVKFIIDLIAILLLLALVAYVNEADASEKDDVALWLARSCVGEAGWGSHQTGECAALMHIYLKRSAKGQLTLLDACRKYSGATKRRRNHPRKWLFELDRSDRKPDSFPSNMNWVVYRDDWLATLDIAEAFLDGEINDPTQEAEHYGSIYDHHSAARAGWWEIKTNFRNRFYSVRKPHSVSTWKAH